MGLGPLMVGVEGVELTGPERSMLCSPNVGGVILFSRNFESVEQLAALTRSIHAVRQPALPIGVDHEGGRVQRFRSGFVSLPAAAEYGAVYDRDPERGLGLARTGGWLMAAELLATGVDFSFAPVLDLAGQAHSVIGNRAFHRVPAAVARLATAFVDGMKAAGMSGVGKHFPGHGTVPGDSHHELPRDDRHWDDIERRDLVPFRRLIEHGIAGIMPAHIVYGQVDSKPAGFSAPWIREILRRELGFEGLVFSDDLGMVAATVAGDLRARAESALDAGCDVVLLCNELEEARRLVRIGRYEPNPVRGARLARMHARPGAIIGHARLRATPAYQEARRELESLDPAPELGLGDDAIS